jgi:hypothetical protein
MSNTFFGFHMYFYAACDPPPIGSGSYANTGCVEPYSRKSSRVQRKELCAETWRAISGSGRGRNVGSSRNLRGESTRCSANRKPFCGARDTLDHRTSVRYAQGIVAFPSKALRLSLLVLQFSLSGR